MTMRLHHVALASPRTDDAAAFYTEDWGMRETGRDGSSVRLAAERDQGEDYSLVLVTSDEKTVDHFCLVTADEETYDAIERRVRAGDVTVLDDAPACPGLEKGLHVVDLDGRRVEIGYRPGEPETPAEPRDAVPTHAAHIVLNAPDIEAAAAWYTEHLGLTVRDRREKDGRTTMIFLYCNEEHHTVAFASAPHASLNHVAYEVPDIDQFFRAVGRATATTTGEKLYGPGRHGPGAYVFCYFIDPAGFVCEYETDSVRIPDPAAYDVTVWKYTPENADQWLGTLSGGPTQRFRTVTTGEPDPGLIVTS